MTSVWWHARFRSRWCKL